MLSKVFSPVEHKGNFTWHDVKMLKISEKESILLVKTFEKPIAQAKTQCHGSLFQLK